MQEADIVELDGSMGEGGGQILRTAVALCAILGKPLRIFNIRAKRSKPGLRPQHLTAVKSVARLCNATVSGLGIGSLELRFIPSKIVSGNMKFDTGTAGSTTLILQSMLPAMAYADGEVELELIGGTNNPLAPPYEYFENVMLPVLLGISFDCETQLIRRGFYPRGGGRLKCLAKPLIKLKPLVMTEFGKVEKVGGLAYSCRLPEHVAKRMAKSAIDKLGEHDYSAEISEEALGPENPKCSVDPGCGIVLFAKLTSGAIIAGDRLGERGVAAEKVGEEAASQVIAQLAAKAPVDSHLGDQMIVWSSLADGLSELKITRLTSHAFTSIEVCRLITQCRIEVDGRLGEPGLVRCWGRPPS